jgi:hypothetical protein
LGTSPTFFRPIKMFKNQWSASAVGLFHILDTNSNSSQSWKLRLSGVPATRSDQIIHVVWFFGSHPKIRWLDFQPPRHRARPPRPSRQMMVVMLSSCKKNIMMSE